IRDLYVTGLQTCALPILLPFRTREIDRTVHSVAKIHLAFEIVLPSRGIGVLKVSHENVGAGIQRVDDHLAVNRPSDFDAAVEERSEERRVGKGGRER